MDVTIRPYVITDQPLCLKIIHSVVINGFLESGVDLQIEKGHLERELLNQENRINMLADKYFVAEYGEQIVGTIASTQPSEPIQIASKQLHLPMDTMQEVIAVYVHPDYQRKGVGTALFQHMITILQKHDITYFALCTGYRKGKLFWSTMLGNESIILPKYYEGHPCHVWIRKISDIL